jgi:hypothetical protein
LLVVQPSQLLKNFGVVWITLNDTTVGTLSCFKLILLLVDMTNLEPDVLFSQRVRRVGDDVLEALGEC